MFLRYDPNDQLGGKIDPGPGIGCCRSWATVPTNRREIGKRMTPAQYRKNAEHCLQQAEWAKSPAIRQLGSNNG